MKIFISIVIYLTVVFTFLSPFFVIAIREAIKLQRQQLIKDLKSVFDISGTTAQTLVPSFEFVKYKYFIGKKTISDINTSIISTEETVRDDYSAISWIIGSLPFSFISSIFMFISLSYSTSFIAFLENPSCPSSKLFIPCLSFHPDTVIWLCGISAAFAGSYITGIRNLYRAVKNFDLSPATLIGESIKVITSVILSPIIVISLVKIISIITPKIVSLENSNVSPGSIAFVVAACFIAGLMPDVAIRAITHRDQLKNFKREEEAVFKAFKITPVEIIDGIDSEIRIRLDDHHIHSTQNLAAANPLMLFVETPFGVYQIMDWVAQAQLCCSVGRDKIVKLWSLGVRTLFDLERLSLACNDTNDELLLEVGRVILGDRIIPDTITNRPSAVGLVKATIELRLDDPHVHRLRQIYIAVGERLGANNRRFRSNTADSPMTAEPKLDP